MTPHFHRIHMTRARAWIFVGFTFGTVILLEGCVAVKLIGRHEMVGGCLIVVGWFKDVANEVIRKLIEDAGSKV